MNLLHLQLENKKECTCYCHFKVKKDEIKPSNEANPQLHYSLKM